MADDDPLTPTTARNRATAPPEPRAATPKATTARRNPSASASRRSASDASRSARKATGPTPKR